MVVYYDESILTYIASIRNYFGLKSSYASNSEFDKIINEKKPNNIFILLVDGMGANQVERKLPEDSFIRRHMLFKTSTVFPPTTTAATTAIENGKAPNENAWLGWNTYLKDENKYVIPFTGEDYYSSEKYGYNYYRDKFPVTTTVEELNAIGINSRELYPAWRKGGCETLEIMTKKLVEYSYSNEYKHIYAYFDEYDSLMHRNGPNSKKADDYLFYVNKCLEELEKEFNEGTMIMVIADHGQIEVERQYDLSASKYNEYFSAKPYIEPRACMMSIKEDKREQFEKEFLEEFEDEFILLNRQQILDTHLFGEKENHPKFLDLISDYIAIGKGHTTLDYFEGDPFVMKGHHAGMNEDELIIPVVIYQK